jgi:hypothetical protein
VEQPSTLDGFRILWQGFHLMPWPFHALVVGSFAALLGSFINVCIWRIPRGQSIVWPRSRCTSCGHVLDALDLIPILMYVLTRGHCRHCKAPVSSRYVIVELINVSIWLTGFALFGMSLPMVAWGIVGSIIHASLGIARMKDEIRREAARAVPDAGRGGFTFISVMLACLILAISVGPFLDVARTGYLGSTKNQEYVKGWALAMERIEELQTLPYPKVVSDRKIYIETEKTSDNIFADEFFGDYSKMREDAKYFDEKFTDVYSGANQLPDSVMTRFKAAYKRHYGTEYETYPDGYQFFRRITTVEETVDKNDKTLKTKRAIVTVEINSKATKGRKLVLETLIAEK